MANTASANKRARQAERRRGQNVAQRSALRTEIKKVRKAVTAGNKAEAQAAFKSAVPVIDKMAGKGIIHKNSAARYKSRINTQIRGMA